MAYDEGLAERICEYFEDRTDVSQKKMFGGLCFLIRGNMCCGIVKDELMLRVGPDAYANALSRPHAREMDFTGRALKGMIYVACDGFAEDEDLTAWLDLAAAFAASLPKKAVKLVAKKAAKKAADKAAKKTASKQRPTNKTAKRNAARKQPANKKKAAGKKTVRKKR